MNHEEILRFWFGELHGPLDFPSEKSGLWFRKAEFTDQMIRRRFLPVWEEAREGKFDSWASTSHGRLALLIILDQFSRNMFRDDPRSFAQDERALKLAVEGVGLKQDQQLFPVERVFWYMPFEHSENVERQSDSVKLFTKLVDSVPAQMKNSMREFLRFAEAHKAVIDRFGRFPHRNSILGRRDTPEETEFLKQPGSSF